jgi:hypothetical protein
MESGGMVSSQLQRYLKIFQILDPVWCFLMRNKTPCSVTNLQKMIRSETEIDLKDLLQRLKIICDPFIILTAVGIDSNNQDLILSYSQFNGISKVREDSLCLFHLMATLGSSKSKIENNSSFSCQLLPEIL